MDLVQLVQVLTYRPYSSYTCLTFPRIRSLCPDLHQLHRNSDFGFCYRQGGRRVVTTPRVSPQLRSRLAPGFQSITAPTARAYLGPGGTVMALCPLLVLSGAAPMHGHPRDPCPTTRGHRSPWWRLHAEPLCAGSADPPADRASPAPMPGRPLLEATAPWSRANRRPVPSRPEGSGRRGDRKTAPYPGKTGLRVGARQRR